jgi:hypothetical protein
MALLLAGAWGPAPAGAASAGGPDLVAEASPGGVVAPGTSFDRRVTVTNRGEASAKDVHVLVELPRGLVFSSVLPVFERGTCTVVSVGSPVGPALLAHCGRPSLSAGATATLRLPLASTSDAACGPLRTEVRVLARNEAAASVDEGNRATIADRGACAPQPGPDVAVRATVDRRGPAPARSRLSYRLEVTNVGNEQAHHVRVTASAPPGLAFVRTPGGPGAGCAVVRSAGPGDAARSSATCAVEALSAGASATFRLDARVEPDPRCTDARMVASVRATDEPRVSRGTENRSTVSVDLACRPRIRLMTRAPLVAHPADRVPITVHARNVSAASIVNVDVRIGGCHDAVRRIDEGHGDRTLSPRERWTFRCHRVVGGAADPATVPVVVVGRDAARQATAARVTRRIDVWHPGIAIDVTTAEASAAPGSRVALRLLVRNTGDAPLRDVTIEVPGTGATSTLASLDAGAATVATLDVTLPRRPGTLGDATVRASDRLERVVEAHDAIPLVVAGAFTDAPGATGVGGGSPRQPSGSAFTGAPPLSFATALAISLAVAGSIALVAARRRRGPSA